MERGSGEAEAGAHYGEDTKHSRVTYSDNESTSDDEEHASDP